MAWVIVKYPTLIHFEPGETKVHPSLSTHDTHSGQACEIKPSYETEAQAKEDLKKIQEHNCGVEYGIFETLED